jgi:hypothetical protein
MRFHRGHSAFLACLLGLILALSGVATQQNSPQNISEADLKEIVIQFERSTCYGTCPAYKLKIGGDGRVEYEGVKFVKQEGRKEGRIAAVDLKRLVTEFLKAQFSTIDQFSSEKCTCTLCTDMPTVTTEFHVKGTSHRVEHYYGCRCAPKLLWDLEQSIDKIVHTEQWTGDVSKQGPFGTTCFNK